MTEGRHPLNVLCHAVCDPENHPHQWWEHPEELERAILSIVGCQEKAEWMLCGKDLYDISYACTEHLSLILADDTQEIRRENPDNEKCCFIH